MSPASIMVALTSARAWETNVHPSTPPSYTGLSLISRDKYHTTIITEPDKINSSSDAPSCFKYARSTTIGDKNVFYSIGCGKSSDDVPALAKPTNGDGQKGATDDSSSGTSQGFLDTYLNTYFSTSPPLHFLHNL